MFACCGRFNVFVHTGYEEIGRLVNPDPSKMEANQLSRPKLDVGYISYVVRYVAQQ